MASRPSIFAVVLTFHPNVPALDELIGRLVPQVDRVLIVDNASTPEGRRHLADIAARFAAVQLHLLEQNQGVATGHNHGIRAAVAAGCDFVLILDQDSLPAPDMVARLLEGYRTACGDGKDVAAVGPRFMHRLTGKESFFVRLGLLRFQRVYCAAFGTELVCADFLISSGALIPVRALEAIGPMRDDLFIDHVDTDWFLRAGMRGWSMYGVCSARMEHGLGERTLRLRFPFRRDLPLHSPLRHYYTFRNSVYLYLYSPYPLRWKLSDAWRLAAMLVLFSLLLPDRRQHLKMMLLGACDGLRRRLGRYDAIHRASPPQDRK
jgi:rhamnosyltransferase